MSIMAMVMDDENLIERERIKAIKMALIHDVAESLVGDIAPTQGIPKAEKQSLELDAMKAICSSLCNEKVASEIMALFLEYEDGKSRTAKFVKDLDKLEMVITALEYEKHYTGKQLGSFFDSTRTRLSSASSMSVFKEIECRRP